MALGDIADFVAKMRRDYLVLLDMIAGEDFAATGYPQPWQVLVHLLRVTPGAAKQLVTQAELVSPRVSITGQPLDPVLPAMREVMAEGAASAGHLSTVAKTLDRISPSLVVERDRAETDLAGAVRKFAPHEVARIGQRIVDALDPDGPEPVDIPVVTGNQLDLRDHSDGSVSGQFTLGAEAAAQLRPLISTLAKPCRSADGPDLRTLAQRNGDALAEVLRIAAGTGDLPAQGGEKPQLAVTVSLHALQTGIGRATLDDGRTITAEQARRIACDSKVIPIVLGGHSQPLDIGKAARTANRTIIRALAIRDKGCAFPACHRTPRQCQAHHVQHWANGGATTLENLVLLCTHHHTLIHHTPWTVHIRHGRPEFTPPEWLSRTA